MSIFLQRDGNQSKSRGVKGDTKLEMAHFATTSYELFRTRALVKD